jgi:hypothetical protein
MKDMTPVHEKFKDNGIKIIKKIGDNPIDIISEMLFQQNNLIQIYFERVGQNPKEFSEKEKTFWIQQMILAIIDEINEAQEIALDFDKIKNAKLNLYYEIIDTIHFVMELIIFSKMFNNENVDFQNIAEDIIKTIPNYGKKNTISIYDSLQYIYKIMKNTHWKHWKTYSNYTLENYKEIYKNSLFLFSFLYDFLRIVFMTNLKEFATHYMIKRLENEDRQKRGY